MPTPPTTKAAPRDRDGMTPAAALSDPRLAAPSTLDPSDDFAPRHIGPDDQEIREMLAAIGQASLDSLVDSAIPASIRFRDDLELEAPLTERAAIESLRNTVAANQVFRSCLGMGYSDCIVPPVIQRNVLENPGWYTQYTPYQSEISQGRLEALVNFQTMVADLTGLPLANASLLDEGTAAAEAMSMCHAIVAPKRREKPADAFFVMADCHPQTIAVVQSRGRSQGIEIVVGHAQDIESCVDRLCGVLVQYPTTDGRIVDNRQLIARVHEAGALVVFAADLLALTLLKSPGTFGADIAIGSTQRFGVPLGGGGPHAAYISTRTEYARKLPGRLVGISRDDRERTAYRLAIQTREQHIKRDRATSNICTAQVLLAIMAGMYAVYHGPDGLRRIGERVRGLTAALREGIRRLGHDAGDGPVFDTLRVILARGTAASLRQAAESRAFNLRYYDDGTVGISLDETSTREDVVTLLGFFGAAPAGGWNVDDLLDAVESPLAAELQRENPYLTHPVFNSYRSETGMLRYLARLQSRDLSLAQSMIPLGSCTMKLNATSEMLPITWPEFSQVHPFAPVEQVRGSEAMFRQLESWLATITGFSAVSLQPNAGSQGEYAGLLVIRAWQQDRGEGHRDVCLIPVSAHGTNPASAIVAGMRVVPVKCDDDGNIDIDDLREKASTHAGELAALMITYPSTHGVFEATVKDVCAIVHEHGGQVYLDGANLNAQVGLCRPADVGADVCHLNLHKTFCIPHGGGGPGMGPIAVAEHLAPFLPGHPVVSPIDAGAKAIGPVSAAPYGSPSILPSTWMYIAMMGGAGLTRASQIAILNANYMARRLEDHYDVLFRGEQGLVAHEFIIDCRPFDRSAGIKIDDIAKRLMDYGFHAPTMSWPVPGTLMIEPTESESKAELDRFCDAMIAIREEIRAIEEGRADREDNVLRHAPHTIETLASDTWDRSYSREQAAYPLPWLRSYKFWPPVGRVDNPYGDRHLACTCDPDWAE